VLAWSSESSQEAGIDSVEFLYINANAGDASGGHTALRIGDSVFHYQFFPDETFLLVRESWDAFRFLYNDLHNRSIASASLQLDISVANTIREHFTELLAAQQIFYDDFAGVQQEKLLLQQLEVAGILEVSVNCLGFFKNENNADFQTNVFREVLDGLESDLLSSLIVEADEVLQRHVQQVHGGERLRKDFVEILAWREAIQVLVDGRPLRPGVLIGSMTEEGELGARERDGLETFSGSLIRSIAELLHSSRPDRGETLLLQLARYLAVQQSLSEGKLVTLDPFFKDVRVVELTDKEIGDGTLKGLQKDLFKQSMTRRELFFMEKQHGEIAYSLLETSRARAFELAQVNDRQRSARILVNVTLPTRPEVVSFPFPGIDEEAVRNNIIQIRQELRELQERSETLYGYNLVWRNCATELIRSLNSTFPDAVSGRETLGGWLEPDSGLLFIPFIFYDHSLSAYSLQHKQFLQARRLRNLERLYEHENDLWVWLRESNTLSSTLYDSRAKDTAFLFFTDDSFLFRPFQGVLNIAYAALHGIAGIGLIPFDGGAHANQALRGIFYSLPELAFGNIRKGSYSTAESVQGTNP